MSEHRRSSVVQVDRSNDGVARINDASLRKLSVINPEVVQEFEEAKSAAEKEHQLTIRDAVKLYPKAIIFSIIFSSAVIMEGYDLSLMGSFFGFPVSDICADLTACGRIHAKRPSANHDPAFPGLLWDRRQSRWRAKHRRCMAVWHSERRSGSSTGHGLRGSGFLMTFQVGSIIGLWLNGIISDKIGYKKVSQVKCPRH